MENTQTNHANQSDFTERNPTNEERWVNDVNKEFEEDKPLVNNDPEDDAPFEDDNKFDEEPPLNDEEVAGEIPIEEEEQEFKDDDLFKLDDSDVLEDNPDDLEYK